MKIFKKNKTRKQLQYENEKKISGNVDIYFDESNIGTGLVFVADPGRIELARYGVTRLKTNKFPTG